ncbi:MAG: translation initiation factor IF-1 [Patescibacteria group bacterium]
MDTPKNDKPVKDSVNGVVTEALPNTLFRVRLDGQENEILAFLGGKMRLNRIRVVIGDKVIVELDKYGGKGRITRRF